MGRQRCEIEQKQADPRWRSRLGICTVNMVAGSGGLKDCLGDKDYLAWNEEELKGTRLKHFKMLKSTGKIDQCYLCILSNTAGTRGYLVKLMGSKFRSNKRILLL